MTVTISFLLPSLDSPSGPGPHLLLTFRYHTQTHHSRNDYSGRTIGPSQSPLPDNTHHKKQTSLPSAGFEPTTPTIEWPQTHALDRTATGIGCSAICKENLTQILLRSRTVHRRSALETNKTFYARATIHKHNSLPHHKLREQPSDYAAVLTNLL